MTQEANESLRLHTSGAVTTVMLDRPQRRNAIDLDTCAALREFLAAADADNRVRAIVITGNERDFCTGADVTAGPTAPPHSRRSERRRR